MVELKQPSDLTGQFVGETAQKTAALIDNCRGKAGPSTPLPRMYRLTPSSKGAAD